MKIAWVSSWPPRHCGIATYSAELVEALRREGVNVHIVCHTDGGMAGEKNVYPVIDTGFSGWDEKLYDTIEKIKPDVIHIQHEFGLYNTSGDNASILFRPLFRWRVKGTIPVVITYHSVYTVLNKMISTYMDVIQRLCHAGIVHAVYQWANLPANLGRVPSNVYIIPHGAKGRVSVSAHDAKKALGIEGKKVLGLLGWFTPTKGFDKVLSIWDEISEQIGTDAVLLLAGDARMGSKVQEEYKNKLMEIAKRCRASDKIKTVIGSFSPEEYEKILSSFDAMVMPYTFASQSGNLAHSLSMGVPVVVSGIEGLKAEVEASGAGIAVDPGDTEELKRALVNIMKDDDLRRKYSKNAIKYVNDKISWPITAGKHIKLYKKLIAGLKEKKKDIRSEALLES